MTVFTGCPFYRTSICCRLEDFVKVVPLINYAPPLSEDILEATSKDVPEERAPFAAGIDEEESNKERLEPGVPLDSMSTIGTNLPVPLTDIARSSQVNEASP
ncbi:hypothetical protein ACOSQ3_007353 [Xanthoceras sorbifolium]